MPTLTVPNKTFNASPDVLGPVNIPQKALDEDGIVVQLTSNNWSANPGRPLRVTIEQSFDNGATWRAWSDDTFTTGAFARDGVTLPSILLSSRDANGTFAPRQARVTIAAPSGNVNAGAVITY